MTTSTISARIGHYNVDAGRVYILPPRHEFQNGHLKDGRKEKDGLDEMSLIRLAPPSHEGLREKSDDESEHFGHFIKQVNVPPRRKSCGADPFSSQFITERFSETVSVPVLPPSGPRQSCASFCNYESDHRFRESVTLEPAMSPAKFRVSMVCYPDSTKKRFRTTLLCCPKLRPRHFGDTNFIQPKRKETRFVSYVDYGHASESRWHTTAVTVTPKTACSNFVHGFQFADGAWSGDDAAGSLDDLESLGSSGFLDDECGSFPGHGDLELHLNDGDVGQDGYRTHMVVGGK